MRVDKRQVSLWVVALAVLGWIGVGYAHAEAVCSNTLTVNQWVKCTEDEDSTSNININLNNGVSIIRSMTLTAFFLASSTANSPNRPSPTRFGLPPLVLAWSHQTLRPVAYTRTPNPGRSRPQTTVSSYGTDSA